MYCLISRVKLKDVMKMVETIGSRVRFFRELRGFTQDRLAKESGLGSRFISSLERWAARYRNPTSEKMEAIAKVLEIHPGLLFKDNFSTFFSDTGMDLKTYTQLSEGARVAVVRKWQGLSVTALAKKCDFSIDELKHLEKKDKLPFARRYRLAFELRIEPYWLGLTGSMLDPVASPKGNKTVEEFNLLFNQADKDLQEMVLRMATAILRDSLEPGKARVHPKKGS